MKDMAREVCPSCAASGTFTWLGDSIEIMPNGRRWIFNYWICWECGHETSDSFLLDET